MNKCVICGKEIDPAWDVCSARCAFQVIVTCDKCGQEVDRPSLPDHTKFRCPNRQPLVGVE